MIFRFAVAVVMLTLVGSYQLALRQRVLRDRQATVEQADRLAVLRDELAQTQLRVARRSQCLRLLELVDLTRSRVRFPRTTR